jgi:hypothetical protein
MNCPIGKMIKGDITLAAFMTTPLIVLAFLDHLTWLIPASLFYVQFWSAIGDYFEHKRWHNVG